MDAFRDPHNGTNAKNIIHCVEWVGYYLRKPLHMQLDLVSQVMQVILISALVLLLLELQHVTLSAITTTSNQGILDLNG